MNEETPQMSTSIEYRFSGCYDDCPYFCGDYKTPRTCNHPAFPGGKEVISYEGIHSEIPEGKKYPDWCPCAIKDIPRANRGKLFGNLFIVAGSASIGLLIASALICYSVKGSLFDLHPISPMLIFGACAIIFGVIIRDTTK
jgi:hypothetical protein